MTDSVIEAQQAATLLGLSGGELESKPWGGHAWWYDGVPEWAGEDFPRQNDLGVVYRTVLSYGSPGEATPPPEPGWVAERWYSVTDEAECWCRGTIMGGDGHWVEANGNEPNPDCKVCEGDGFVSWGAGWVEIVYRDAAYERACELDETIEELESEDWDLGWDVLIAADDENDIPKAIGLSVKLQSTRARLAEMRAERSKIDR